MSSQGPLQNAPPLKFPVHTVLKLFAFPGLPAPHGRLSARLEITADHRLRLEYRWRSKREKLSIPRLIAGEGPSRQQGLWERTCFEVFFRQRGASAYHEVNVSPCGDWNVYSFTKYREGMKQEDRIASVSLERLEDGAGEVTCAFSLPLTALGLRPEDLEFSVTSVIQAEGGVASYWALEHSGEKPDFHDPRSFAFHF